MAKKAKRSGVNRSQAIRDYLKQHPKATASEIIPALAAQGVKVSKNLVSNVKYHSPKLKKGRRVGTGKAARRGSLASKGGELTAQHLFDAKNLVDELGGIAAVRSALDALEELQ